VYCVIQSTVDRAPRPYLYTRMRLRLWLPKVRNVNTSNAGCLETCPSAERRPTVYSWPVQPVSIHIVFGCKQAQQYSKTHHLGFIRAVSWSAQNSESHWSHAHVTLTVDHFSFHAFYKKCGLQRDLISSSSR